MRLGATAAVVAGALAAGCARPAGPSGRPANLLVVTLDTVRADHCSAYGYARPTTPRLERLAGEGSDSTWPTPPCPPRGPPT